ncbi:hypothetical protein N7470_000612 [Penicillium chermesinum]|nr:hypothetical protein N7470_000612 [Penicillium chermesinum]
MAPVLSRVKQEQLRKRRNNLLKRHNEFWRLYSIRSWLVMEMPNGRIYTYQSNPGVQMPSEEDINSRSQSAVHRTPADYEPTTPRKLTVPTPPVFDMT